MSNPNYPPSLPPKQKTSAFKVMLGVLGAFFALVLFGIVGCVALFGSAADDNPSVRPDTDSFTSTPTPVPASRGVDKNLPPKLVPGYQVGPFQLAASIKITRDGLGHFDSRVRVKNTSETEAMAIFKITLLKGSDILTTLDCVGGGGVPVKPDGTATAQCISLEKYTKGWTQVHLEYTGL